MIIQTGKVKFTETIDINGTTYKKFMLSESKKIKEEWQNFNIHHLISEKSPVYDSIGDGAVVCVSGFFPEVRVWSGDGEPKVSISSFPFNVSVIEKASF